MAKPSWLKENEEWERRLIKLKRCHECSHYGPHVRTSKHKGKESTSVHECALHPGCFNTKYSFACKDFAGK